MVPEKQILDIYFYLLFSNVDMTESCRTTDCNVTIGSSLQKPHVQTAPETLWGSLDSTSRSHTIVLEQVSPSIHALDLLQTINERVGETSSTHPQQVLGNIHTSMEEVGANCKDHGKDSPLLPMAIKSKNKCLQVGSITAQKCHLFYRDTFLYG